MDADIVRAWRLVVILSLAGIVWATLLPLIARWPG